MKILRSLLATVLAFIALPAMAHTGPDAMDAHFIEHMLLALIVGLPAGYALLRLAAGFMKQDR
ncbi:MAG: hypothetical protein ABW146_00170 [Candidatus Sedimenticola sp. 6PFRAG7]